MVKYHYEKPAKLLPSLRDVLRVESVYGQQQQQQQQPTVKSEVMTDDEDELRNCDGGDDGEVLYGGCYEMNGNGSVGEGVVNGVLKTDGEVFNGLDVVKKEVFLPDIVTDVSGEGKEIMVGMWNGWCMGLKTYCFFLCWRFFYIKFSCMSFVLILLLLG